MLIITLLFILLFVLSEPQKSVRPSSFPQRVYRLHVRYNGIMKEIHTGETQS